MQLTSCDRVLGQSPFGGRRSQCPLRDWQRTTQWAHAMTREVLLPQSLALFSSGESDSSRYPPHGSPGEALCVDICIW